MSALYVIDTNGIISYFKDVFENAPIFDGTKALSTRTRNIIFQAIGNQYGGMRLSVPSVVFIEIYVKWLQTEEFARKFYYEVFAPLEESPNVEIKPIDQEVLENLIRIGGVLANHDLHDKIVVASAMMLECPLITMDEKIIEYADSEPMIPSIIN